jgi:hypothetical protein
MGEKELMYFLNNLFETKKQMIIRRVVMQNSLGKLNYSLTAKEDANVPSSVLSSWSISNREGP